MACSGGLVGVQVALSVTLLAGAGLLLRSFEMLSRVDPGFESERVLAFRVSGSNFEFVNSDVPARVERTRVGLESVPGVESAAVAGILRPSRGGTRWNSRSPRTPRPTLRRLSPISVASRRATSRRREFRS